MRLPSSGADPIATDLPDISEEYIRNPYFGKENLTLLEAYDLLSLVSSQVYADGIARYGQKKHSKRIRPEE